MVAINDVAGTKYALRQCNVLCVRSSKENNDEEASWVYSSYSFRSRHSYFSVLRESRDGSDNHQLKTNTKTNSKTHTNTNTQANTPTVWPEMRIRS